MKLETWVVGITAGSREVPGRNACDRRHTYLIIIIISACLWTDLSQGSHVPQSCEWNFINNLWFFSRTNLSHNVTSAERFNNSYINYDYERLQKEFVGVLWLACFKMTSANTYLPTKISEFVVLANIFKQSLSISVSCDAMLNRLIEIIQCCKVTCCIQIQGRKFSEILTHF